nr:uncharacterized protein LOC123764950 isoform X2 [Procambarus clarkii]
MPDAGPILPRPDLTLHHAPPSAKFRDPPSAKFRDPPSAKFRDPPSAKFRDPPSAKFRDPPLRPARLHTRPSLKSVPEERSGNMHRWSAPCDTSFTLPQCGVPGAASTVRHSRNISLRRYNSLRSRTSYSLRRSIRRAGPLYRAASLQVGSARRAAAHLRKRISGGSAVPLLTPGRSRRGPVIARARERPPARPARNSPRVRAARRAAFAARTVQWEAASGLAALFECGGSAGGAAVTGVVRVWAAAVAMAEARLQQLRRSISSWSLSTIKKPKIAIPKLKTPKFKVFGGRKKNRIDPKDDAAAVEEVKAALLKVEGDGEGGEPRPEAEGVSGEVIHEPPDRGRGEDQPTIVLTLHDDGSPPEPPPPAPCPGLLSATDDLEFIDSDEADSDDRVVEAIGPDVEYCDQWFDARGTLTRSKEDIARIIDDYDDCRTSKYYDAADEAAQRLNGTESVGAQINSKEKRGSLKSREWVKSFNEEAESRIQRWMRLQKTKNPSSLPKSKSEIRLDGIEEPGEKWSARDEIQLNATRENEAHASYLHKEYNDNVKITESERQQASEKKQEARKENLKKIFQVKGKLSIKPIVDSQRPTYTDTDIYIASTPYALASTTDSRQPDGESLDASEDGINCSSADLDPALDEYLVSQDNHQNNGDNRHLFSKTKQENAKESKLTLNCDPLSIPNIVIETPGVTEKNVEFSKQLYREERMRADYIPQSKAISQEQDTTEVSVNSEPNDVIQNEIQISSKDTGTPSHEQDAKPINMNANSEAQETEEETESESVSRETNTTILSTSEAKEIPSEVSKDQEVSTTILTKTKESSSAQTKPETTEIQSLSDSAKSDVKKRKITGANIPKSIKNFAGSFFTQQTSGKAKNVYVEEKEGDKKKKKGRISPFTKDYLSRGSKKAAPEEVENETGLQPGPEKASGSVCDKNSAPVNTNPFIDDDGNPFTDDDMEETVPGSTDDEPTATMARETLPDLLPSSGIGKPPRESPDSLEYTSVIESDEQKSISHESSPGAGTSFVEEGGLRLRKDALLAIKSMNNDDASTHYYSFLSATDDYHTPTNEATDDYNTPTTEIEQREEIPMQEMLQEEDTFLHTSQLIKFPNSTHDQTHDKKTRESSPAEPNWTEKPTPVQDPKPDVLPNESQRKIIDEENKENLESKNMKLVINKAESPQRTPVTSLPAASVKSPGTMQETVPPSQLIPQYNDPVSLELADRQVKSVLFMSTQEPPKPSPRNKKGRYGYGTGDATLTTTTLPVSTSNSDTAAVHDKLKTLSNHGMNGTTAAIDKPQIATFPRRSASCKKAPPPEPDINSSDSGYVGPGSNYYGGTDSEPIYWEISETKGAPPRPSPRSRKPPGPPGDRSLNQPLAPSPPSLSATPTNTPVQDSQPVPEWINKRAPVPSPRSKKQRSLQSLPTFAPTDDTMEAVKKKLQLLSHEPLQDSQVLQQPITAQEEFYSGKAASISYGFTQSTRAAPPSPPMRVRKVSQISLPAAVVADDATWRQQKRRTVHGGDGPPGPLSARRARRRTDPTQGLPIPSIRAAVQAEELLTDVLYSVHSLMGGTGGGVWAVGGPAVIAAVSAGGQIGSGTSNRTSVSLDQVLQVLQAAFQVNQDTVDRLLQDVQSRQAPEVTLHLSLKEAKELRPKTVKGTTNSYVTLGIPNSGESHRTRLEKDTLNPKWNQDFTLRVNNLQKDVLQVEVWHEHDALGVKQLTAVRDIKGLSRLVRGTTAQAQHQAAHLLGQVTFNVKDVSERGLNGWHPLEKKSEVEESKERGSILLVGSLSSSAHLENKNRQSYDSLLARLVHHQLIEEANNKQEDEWSPPWNGRVSGSAAAALAQFAIMLGLNDAALQLSWWCVGSRIATVDTAWTLSQLHRVQAALAKGAYRDEDLGELRTSLSSFVRASAERIKTLHTAFPPSSGVLAQHQLTYTLKVLYSMQNHNETQVLLAEEGLPYLHETVTSSLAVHTKNWWTAMIEEQLRGVRTADEQISRVINIVDESNTFLTYADKFYNSIFLKEMNIPYMQTTYLVVSKKVNPCVRPLVMNIYNRMPLFNEQREDADDAQYALEVGTSLWQLYRNLSHLHTLGESLPAEARSESGVREYHRWFSRGVMRWLELAISRAQDMIRKAVDLDCFEPVDAFCNFSSSATDTIGIFHDVKIWWLKLAWPDPENSAVLLAKILEDICSCGTTYSDLLRNKVDTMLFRQDNSSRVFFTSQICVGLNNIERVRQELTGLPGHFGFDAQLEEIRSSGSGNGAAAQLEATVERLIFSAAENMEAKVNEFIETVIDKMRPTLEKAANDACEAQDEFLFLGEVLNPAMELLRKHLHTSNFHRFLWRVWEVIIDIFNSIVRRNTERRRANYFGGVHSIVQATLNFFTPNDGVGLDEVTAQTPEYTSLIELLECLRMSTEALISKYYQERYDEQVEDILPSKAQLVAKMLFTRPGKLIVEVIMARDIVVESDAGSVSSRGGGQAGFHNQPVDSYVKVQLVPQEWFPAASIYKTKIQRKQDPAVYEETFEFDMSKNDDGVRAGFILFTLKDYNLGRSNTFIGEALVPLANLPCVDSSQVHTVSNTYFKMTTPGLDIGYKSLRALHFRTADKIAYSFVKRVSKRLLDARAKLSTTLRPDEEKSRSKSPTLIERLKFS